MVHLATLNGYRAFARENEDEWAKTRPNQYYLIEHGEPGSREPKVTFFTRKKDLSNYLNPPGNEIPIGRTTYSGQLHGKKGRKKKQLDASLLELVKSSKLPKPRSIRQTRRRMNFVWS